MKKKVKTVFYLLIMAVIVYVAYMFAGPYYRYHAFKAEAGGIIRLEARNEEQMRGRLLEAALDSGINLEEGDLDLYTDFYGVYTATITWHETVDLKGLYCRRLDFRIEMDSKGGLRK